jgi:hypothetical protein
MDMLGGLCTVRNACRDMDDESPDDASCIVCLGGSDESLGESSAYILGRCRVAGVHA